jgi:hypothetical protein
VGRPSYDDDTLAAYFQPVHPMLHADPVMGPLLRRLQEVDPDLVLAVADVDRSQIRARERGRVRHVRGAPGAVSRRMRRSAVVRLA